MTGQTETNVNQCIKLNSDGTAAEVAYAGVYKEGQTNIEYYLYNSAITIPW